MGGWVGDRVAAFRKEGGRDGDGLLLVASVIKEPNYIKKMWLP